MAQLDDEHAASEIKLSDVQFALARENGYANWTILKQTDHQPEMRPDFSKPGSAGSLPEDFVRWRWGVSYTVRPELLTPLVYGQEYLITASILKKKPNDETFSGYADLYEDATAIAHACAASLRCARGSLHTRLLNHTWFRHGSTDLVRAAVTPEITCGKESDAKPDAQPQPTPEALASPGGMTVEEAAALPKRTWHEIYSVGELREPTRDKPAIFGFSYGEFAISCDEIDYAPY